MQILLQNVGKKSISLRFPTYYKIQFKGFQINYNPFCFSEKNGFKSIFSTALSERKMGIDYVYHTLEYENPH